MDPNSLYILCITLGLVLFGLELFLPGGVIGAVGGVCLLVSIVLGYKLFGAHGGTLSAVIILIGVCIYIALVLRYLPDSFIGRKLTLQDTLKDSRSSQQVEDDLVGRQGTAVTDLRPSGIVKVGPRRIDVTADSAWIEKGTTVQITRVQGNRITVRKTTAS